MRALPAPAWRVAAVAALWGACAPATAAASDAPVEREIARVDALHGAPAVLAGAGRPATLELRFALPEGASQGPDRWYFVRLRYRLRFASDTGRGFAWVTSDTNDRTAAQIEYTTVRRHGRLSVRRTTVDLQHGQRERRSHSRTDEVTFTNYLQYAGVRPGENTWTISVEQAGGARVERVEVLGDSAIVETTRTPFPLTLSAVAKDPHPAVGKRFAVRATLAARAGQPADDVVVRAEPTEDGGVKVVGSPTRRIGRVAGGARTVTFTFLARRAGRHQIVFLARSAANKPTASVMVDVAPSTKAQAAPLAAWGLGSVPALGMAAWLVRSRRRRLRT